jgi:hypothetical protein
MFRHLPHGLGDDATSCFVFFPFVEELLEAGEEFTEFLTVCTVGFLGECALDFLIVKAVLDGPVFASVRGEFNRPEGSMVMLWTGHSRCELV